MATKSQLLKRPATADYKPGVVGAFTRWRDHRGPWGPWDLEMMRRDPRVRLGLRTIKAPLAVVKWKVTSPRTEVADWVHRQLTHLWRKELSQLLAMIDYGRSGGEVVWRLDRRTDLIEIDSVRHVYYLDMLPLELDGSFWGLRVKGADEDLPRGRCLYLVNEPELHPYYGRSRLVGAWEPWSEKSQRHGARDVRRTWNVKNAYNGGLMRHPPGEIDLGGGQTMSNQDYAREVAEKFETGGILILPNAREADGGEYQWTYEFPSVNGDVPGIQAYVEALDIEILEGLEIPPEVLQAQQTGSWAGRTVPFLVFLTAEDSIADNIISTADEHAIRPGAEANFGADVEYEIEIESLVPKDEEQGGTKGGGGAGGLAGLLGGGDDQGGGGAEPEAGENLGLEDEQSEEWELLAQGDEWVAYIGQRGANKGKQVGWKHAGTGRIVYGDKKPGGGGDKAAAAKAKPAAKPSPKAKEKPVPKVKPTVASVTAHAKQVLASPTREGVLQLLDGLMGLKVADMKAVRQALGDTGKGGRTKSELARKVAEAVIGKEPEPAKPEAKQSATERTTHAQRMWDIYDHAKELRKGGLVKVPELVDRLQATHKDLTREEAHEWLREMQREGHGALQLVNDRYLEPRAGEGIETPRGSLFYVQILDEPKVARPESVTPAQKPAEQPQAAAPTATPAQAKPAQKPAPAATPKQYAPTDEEKQAAVKALATFVGNHLTGDGTLDYPRGIAETPADFRAGSVSDPDELRDTIADAINAHANEYAAGIPLDALFKKVRENHPSLTVEDFQKTLMAMHDSHELRASGWPKSLDEIPDPTLAFTVASKVMYYANQPAGSGAGRKDRGEKKPAPKAPAEAAKPAVATPKEHADTVLAAVKKLDTQGLNYVLLADLRDELGQAGLDRSQQDAAITHLRKQGVLSASALEGRHGASQRDLDAAIHEGGAQLGAVSLRAPQAPATKPAELSTEQVASVYDQAGTANVNLTQVRRALESLHVMSDEDLRAVAVSVNHAAKGTPTAKLRQELKEKIHRRFGAATRANMTERDDAEQQFHAARRGTPEDMARVEELLAAPKDKTARTPPPAPAPSPKQKKPAKPKPELDEQSSSVRNAYDRAAALSGDEVAQAQQAARGLSKKQASDVLEHAGFIASGLKQDPREYLAELIGKRHGAKLRSGMIDRPDPAPKPEAKPAATPAAKPAKAATPKAGAKPEHIARIAGRVRELEELAGDRGSTMDELKKSLDDLELDKLSRDDILGLARDVGAIGKSSPSKEKAIKMIRNVVLERKAASDSLYI